MHNWYIKNLKSAMTLTSREGMKMSTTFNGVPMSLANYEGVNRFAYVVDDHGVTAPEGSRAVYFAKQAERRGKFAEVWSRNNAGDWMVDVKYNDELRKQVAALKPEEYIQAKNGAPKAQKSNLQTSLFDLSAIARTLSKNLAGGFSLTEGDANALSAAMNNVLEQLSQPE